MIDEFPAVAALSSWRRVGPAPAAVREVNGSGESYRAVKVLYAPDALRCRLGSLAGRRMCGR